MGETYRACREVDADCRNVESWFEVGESSPPFPFVTTAAGQQIPVQNPFCEEGETAQEAVNALKRLVDGLRSAGCAKVSANGSVTVEKITSFWERLASAAMF